MSLEASGKRGYWKVRDDPRRVTTSKCPAVHTALRRLSDSQYNLLESFRREYPSLHLECMGRPANAFILFRSHYVARIAQQNDEEHDSKVNQSILSSQAGKVWKFSVPSESKKPYQDWASQISKLWNRMYPNGLPPAAMKAKANSSPRKHSSPSTPRRKSKSRPRTRYPKKPSSSSTAPRSTFQPLPSPAVSDDADFEEGMEESCNSFDGYSDSGDGEYVPTKSSCRRHSTPSAMSIQTRTESQLLTPESTTRELSLPLPSSPVFYHDPEVSSTPPSPAFHDISLFELNDEDGCYTFPNCHIPFEFCMTNDPFNNHFDEIAVGYSFEEHANVVMDWGQIDLMSDLDPVGLHPIINTPYSPDTTTVNLTEELGSNLDLSRLS